MTDWINPDVVLKVPQELAIDLQILARKDDKKKTWAVKSREILYSYVAMHRARGNVE